jgi:acyl carrier protein
MVTADEVRSRLRGYISSELLSGSQVAFADDDPLFSGGVLDSFSMAEIGVWLEQELGVYIPDGELTVDRMDSLNLMVGQALRADGG